MKKRKSSANFLKRLVDDYNQSARDSYQTALDSTDTTNHLGARTIDVASELRRLGVMEKDRFIKFVASIMDHSPDYPGLIKDIQTGEINPKDGAKIVRQNCFDS